MESKEIHQKLEYILSSSNFSEECKIESLDISRLDQPYKETLESEMKILKYLNREDLPFSQFHGKKRYIIIDKEKSVLFPIKPRNKVLISKGILINGQNNLKNLEEYAIFGNPSERYPTYLSNINRSLLTYSTPDCILAIDTKKLSKKRSIFIDPETIKSSNESVGDAYFVLGGIPKEAIIEILYDKRILVNPEYPNKHILERFLNYDLLKEKERLTKKYEKDGDKEFYNLLKLIRKKK